MSDHFELDTVAATVCAYPAKQNGYSGARGGVGGAEGMPILTAPETPTAPAGFVIAPYPQQGSDGVWLWRLTRAAKRRVKHEGYPTRYLTVDLGDLISEGGQVDA